MAARRKAASEAALEAELLTFAAEHGASLAPAADEAAADGGAGDGDAASGGGAASGAPARRKGAGAWKHGLALFGAPSPPGAPPPPPGGLRYASDLSRLSADAFASDTARLTELSLKGAPPYAVGAMHLETVPVPLPAPAGAIDAKRQWGGAPDGARAGRALHRRRLGAVTASGADKNTD